MAIDVEQIIRFVLYGEGERVSGPFAITTEWYDRSVAPLPYDPEGGAARCSQRRAGGAAPDGILEKDGKRFEFALITNNGNPQRKAIATIAQNAWRKIGIDCSVQLFEWAVFLKDFINTGQLRRGRARLEHGDRPGSCTRSGTPARPSRSSSTSPAT